MIADKKYRVIYADPPWHFKNFSVKGEGRNAVSHYNCLSIEDLKRLPISDLAAPDSVLFMWATDPLLPQAIDLIEHWGFKFKTVGFYWAKVNKKADMEALSQKDFFTGLGYWTRANVEQCLLATRGKPSRISKSVRRLIVEKRREHSRKPDAAYERIENLMEGPYLELFARSTRPGWDAWGDQAGLLDEAGVETRMRPSRWIEDEPVMPKQLVLTV